MRMTEGSLRYVQRLILLLLFVFISASIEAQSPGQQILRSAGEVVQTINLATHEILVVVDVLRTAEVADALREAIAVRGVPVYILVPSSTVEENASYIAGLAYAGATVRLSDVGGSFLVIDRRTTVAGPLIGNLGQADEGGPTILIDDPTYAAPFVEGFRRSFEAAQIYVPIGQ